MSQCVTTGRGEPEKTNQAMYQHIMQDLLSTQSLNYFPTKPKLHMAQRLAQFQVLLYPLLCVYVILHFIIATNLFIKTFEKLGALT